MVLFTIVVCLIVFLCVNTDSSSLSVPCSHARWDANGTIIASDLGITDDGMHEMHRLVIAIDSHDNLIVASQLSMQKYFQNGTIQTLANGIAVDSMFVDRFDNIFYNTDYTVYMLNQKGETRIVAGNTPGSDLDQLSGATGIYVDNKETVYISDDGNQRVMKFSVNATKGTVVAGDDVANPLNSPMGIFVDENNERKAVYVCDTNNHRIQLFRSGYTEGVSILGKGVQPIFDDSFFPHNVFVDSNGVVYVSHETGLLKWLPTHRDAQVILKWKRPEFLYGGREHPVSFTFDSSWNLYVTDRENISIKKFLFNKTSCM